MMYEFSSERVLSLRLTYWAKAAASDSFSNVIETEEGAQLPKLQQNFEQVRLYRNDIML